MLFLVSSRGFFPKKIYGFKGTLSVLPDKVIENNAALRQDLLYSKGALLAVTAGHDLRPKCDLHFGSRPDVLNSFVL